MHMNLCSNKCAVFIGCSPQSVAGEARQKVLRSQLALSGLAAFATAAAGAAVACQPHPQRCWSDHLHGCRHLCVHSSYQTTAMSIWMACCDQLSSTIQWHGQARRISSRRSEEERGVWEVQFGMKLTGKVQGPA